MTTPDLEPGWELWAHNRRHTARRWPDGALATCEQLEREHRPWHVTWMQANPIRGWQRLAGFAATRDDAWMPRADEMRWLPEDGVPRHPWVFGATVPELLERMAAMQRRIDAQARLDEMFWRARLDR